MKKIILSIENQVPAHIFCENAVLPFADRPYAYGVTWEQGNKISKSEQITNVQVSRNIREDGNILLCIEGQLNSAIGICQQFIQPRDYSWLEETIMLTNLTKEKINIHSLRFGFRRSLVDIEQWRFVAVPFRIQADGKVHDYSVQNLVDGQYCNSNQREHCWTEEGVWPPTVDEGKLRSEAWLWTDGHTGLLAAKYNNTNIEMSLAEVERSKGKDGAILRFGGIGLSLYDEPRAATCLSPLSSFTFGVTRYEPYFGPIAEGYNLYKKWIRSYGHGFPAEYNPPVNWEVLYDLGWHLCNKEKLNKYFTLETLRGEALKAKEIGSELLYLDPGWETCEGVNEWDAERLGNPKDFVEEMKNEYGLETGFRVVGHVYRDEFPHNWYCRSNEKTDNRGKSGLTTGKRVYWRTCACCDDWRKDHIRRMRTVAENGMKFMMHDENSWFGPCFATDHGHSSLTTPLDHVRAIYTAIREMRKQCPDTVVECHDPVWSWFVRYIPVYFMQGFNENGCYQENWGFEIMWNCIDELLNGRALVLYYYAMGTDVPLYLHTSMVTDNDELLFFWWAASTVRHLGIGGKYHNFQPELREMHCPDIDKRWEKYKEQMKIYKLLKPYFVRGDFYGLGEEAHLHTLSGEQGGVLNLFNLSKEKRHIRVGIPACKLRIVPAEPIEIAGDAEYKWDDDMLTISAEMNALAPRIILIGSATKRVSGMNN